MKNIVSLKSTTFIKHKIHNFYYQYFYAQALAYKEFIKLATLIKKQLQTVEPRFKRFGERKKPWNGLGGWEININLTPKWCHTWA